MNETKHTPGPWYTEHVLDSGKTMVFGGKTSRYICSVTIKQLGGGVIAESMESERKANARLIAAAPDLFEACKELVRALCRKRGDNNTCIICGKPVPFSGAIYCSEKCWRKDSNDCITLATQAIAKAEGE